MTFSYRLMVDWDNDGVCETDEAGRLISARINRGRLNIFAQPYVGKATLRLQNYDGRFTPWNTGSAIYPNVAPGRRVQVIVNDGTSDYYIFSGRLESPKTVTVKRGAMPDTFTLTAQDGWRWLSDQKTNIALATSKTTGDAINDILSAVGWIEGGNVWILGTTALDTAVLGGVGIGENAQLDTGNDTIPYWWTADETAAQSIWDLVRSEFGRVQINGDGVLVFKARQSDFMAANDVALTDGNVQEVTVETPWEWVKNKVKVIVTPRTLTSTTEVWYLRDTPYILSGDSLTLWAEFLDSNGKRAPVSEGVNPVATTDYLANTSADGTGTNATASVTVTPTFYSTACKLVVTNNYASTVYITFLHIRGKMAESLDASEFVADDATGQASMGVLEHLIELPWQQSSQTATDYANWLVGFLKTPQVCPRVVMQSQALSVQHDLGAKVGWNSTVLGFDKEFRIGELVYDIRKGQDLKAEWLLLPTGNENFWILDTSELGVDTALGY